LFCFVRCGLIPPPRGGIDAWQVAILLQNPIRFELSRPIGYNAGH
jgi:hypothetical protein